MGTAAHTPPPNPSHSRMEARLKERHAIGTEDFNRVFGKAPGRWLQMEKQHGTLGACQLILTELGAGADWWVTVLTPLWEARRLHHSVEAVALEEKFAPLFTDAERAVARDRLTKLGYFKT